MKPNHYRCGDCRQVHMGKPDPHWKCCPQCLATFLRKYAALVAQSKKPDPPVQLELFR